MGDRGGDKGLAAFFLCAGYGQRLRPLTDRLPKPAISFLGRPVLEINNHVASRLYPSRRICNVHHLYDTMDRVAWKAGMEVLFERDILGTGGALAHAAPVLDQHANFLVHNGDLIHTIDLVELYNRHQASPAIATLAGVFRTAHNTLSCSAKGRLLGVHGYRPFDHTPEATRLTFAGVAFYRRSFLKYLQPGPEDIKRYWAAALDAGETIEVVNVSQDSAWYDIGTPQGLWDAAKFLMEEVKEFSHGYHPEFQEARPYVSNEVGMEGLPDHLRNVLILEETARPVPEGTHDCVLGMDFQWKISP